MPSAILSRGHVSQRVISILENAGHGPVAPAQSLRGDLALDSLDMVEFAISVEKEFDIVIQDRTLDGFGTDTVDQVIDAIFEIVSPTTEKE